MSEDIKSLDEIVIKIREISKQSKQLNSLVAQMNEHCDQLKQTALCYDVNVREVYKTYADIFELMMPVCDVIIASSQPSDLRNTFQKVKTLFQQARIQQHETQLVLPLFEIKIPD